MRILVPTLVLIALSANGPAAAAERAGVSGSPATRHGAGAPVTFMASARIFRASARVGAGLGPPMPRMVARRTLVSAADGRPVPALVYDFE